MGKIDTSEWKEFRIKDLFETQKKGNKLQVPTGASVPVQDLLENGATPRITVTGSNNGIFGFYDYCGKNIADYRVFNNFVSVSFLGTVFYQEGDATLDMKVHCLKPKGITLNKYTGRFLVGAIRASLRESTYSDQISSSILPEMSIKLPATPDGAPDWAYMESYMANIETKVAESLTMLQAAKDAEKKKVDTREWGEFRVGELFKTQMKGKKIQVPTGANVPMQDMIKDGSTPRITVTGVNNGVFGLYDYCGKNSTEYRVFRNFISVSFLGTVFYQEGEATLDMKVHCLQPNHITLNKYTGNFLVSAIKASLRESSYSDQISSTILPEMTIMLPKDKTGQPDWAYMEEYMMEVEKKTNDALNFLDRISTRRKIDGV